MAYSAEIDVKVRNLGSISKLEEKLSSINRSVNAINRRRTAGASTSRSGRVDTTRAIREQLTGEKQITDEIIRRKNAFASLNKVKDGNDPVSKSIRRNQERQQKLRRANLSDNVDSRFLTGQKSEARVNIQNELNKRKREEKALQAKLGEMEEKSNHLAKQRLKDRRRTRSLGNDIVKQTTREVENRLKARRLESKSIAPKGDFSRISDRQSRNREGERTFMNSAFGRRGIRPTRGFDAQSALISGAFPLLFGQGPIGAVAGGLGGGIGGMFGTMGGFAGGIAATALVQQIQSFVDGISKIGQALGPFTQNTQAVTDALGLQGSAQEAQIKLIEQVEGKTAAFNAATALMAREIGQGGVEALEKFGNTSRLMSLEFSRLVLQVQQATARLINFTARVLGLTEALEKGEAQDLVAGAAAGGNKAAQGLVDERANQGFFSKLDNLVNNSFLSKVGMFVPGAPGAAIRGFGDITSAASSLSGQKADEENLSKKEKLFAVGEKIRIQAGAITNESKLTFKSLQDELDLKNRIIENEKKMSTALAEKVSKVEQEFDFREKTLKTTLEQLTKERDKIKENAEKRFGISEQEQKDIDIANAKIEAQEGLINTNNELRKDSIDLTKELHTEVDKVAENFKTIGQSIASGVSDNLSAAIMQTKTLGDAAKSILNDLSSTLIKLGVNTILKGISPGFFGSLSGLGFADGGRPPVGKASIVGEKGPELFVPRRSGTIIPNDKLGGGSTNINVNVDASGSSVQGDEQQSKELGRLISVAIQSELLKQRRPGGLLR